jgi:simple sugar transport system ATP-binding protein
VSEHGADCAIEMRGISKSFGSVVANERVDLEVRDGEIHALLGENGAGKSTLMNMLAGIYRPDTGTIRIRGEEVHFATPADSIKRGIGMIHQHFKLVEVMTATDNIALGMRAQKPASGARSSAGADTDATTAGAGAGAGDAPAATADDNAGLTGPFLNRAKLAERIRAVSDRYGLDIDPNKKIYEMSVGEKQTLEIMKVLMRGARILIMDEPTAVLTPQEIKRLFAIVRSMRDDGCAVVIITHKLNEVMEVSDRVTVLRRGVSVGTVETRGVALPTLIEMVVGRSVDLSIQRPSYTPPPDAPETSEPLLRLDAVSVTDKDKKAALDGVSFDLAAGEILGVAGVAGSGQKELCEVIAGLTRASGGRIFFEGDNILGKTPRDIMRLGIRIGFIPEDRLGMGLVASMDLVENLMLKDYRKYAGPLLRRAPSVEKAERIVERLDILTPSIHTPVSQLSGGNIQKVLLGREIDSDPRVLITAYPVRGLDIGASYRIYDLLNEQKMAGVGIVFIGEDLDVLLELCDRIVVLCGGAVTGIVDARRVGKEELGFLMTGGQTEGTGRDAA